VAEVDPWATYEWLTSANPGRLTSSQRQLLALGALRTDLRTGGFGRYFFNSTGDSVLDALAAAEQSEAVELSSLVRQALEVLNASDPRDRDSRREALLLLEEEAFEELDSAYLALEAATDLDRFMRAVIV
jgi:hypothetical protein